MSTPQTCAELSAALHEKAGQLPSKQNANFLYAIANTVNDGYARRGSVAGAYYSISSVNREILISCGEPGPTRLLDSICRELQIPLTVPIGRKNVRSIQVPPN